MRKLNLKTPKKAKHFANKSGVAQIKKKKKKSKAIEIRKLASSKAFKKRFRVTSASSGNRYTVALSNYGTWQCNCMGFMRNRNCKHIHEILKRKLK